MFFKGFAKTAKNVDFDCKIFKDRGNVWFFFRSTRILNGETDKSRHLRMKKQAMNVIAGHLYVVEAIMIFDQYLVNILTATINLGRLEIVQMQAREMAPFCIEGLDIKMANKIDLLEQMAK